MNNTSNTYELKITDRGNGFPCAGELLYEPVDDRVYRILEPGSEIHTGTGGNYIYGLAELVGDPFDVTEEEFNKIREVGIELIP